MDNKENLKGSMIIYQSEDGNTKIDVKIENDTVWLSQQQMAELFHTSRTNVIEHINNIYEEEELDKNSTCQNFRQVRLEGNRNVTREIPYYNLDMIISLGYRIKSKIATNFRKWATERLKDYIKQLDSILSSTGNELLVGAGTVSHNDAIEKAKSEYKKYQVKTISPVEKVYIETIKELNNKMKDNKGKNR